MGDGLTGFIIIIFCLLCTILPCILLRKLYERKCQKKEDEFLSYLKKAQFNFKNEKHLRLIRQASIDKYFGSLKILTTILVFNTLAIVKSHRLYSVVLFTILFILLLFKWFRKFDDSDLKAFTCPKCHGKVCWFEKEEPITGDVTNGNKQEKHKIHYCERCHYKVEDNTKIK